MRKRWTPQEEITDSLLSFREKRKWQIALRRYLIEEKPSPAYAPYFALDIVSFRNWIALQFEGGLHWNNFSSSWQLEQMVPINYFNFSDPEDMKLAWNFTNIKVERIDKQGKEVKLEKDTNQREGQPWELSRVNRLDILGARDYYETLFQRTGYTICRKMLEHIRIIIALQLKGIDKQVLFFTENKDLIDNLSGFSSYQMEQLNTGVVLEDILREAVLLNKMGL